jgi:hypothetical protein
MSDRGVAPKPDDLTVPADIESPEEKLTRLAAEIGGESWKDGATSRPKSRYSYDVVER